MSDFYWAGSVPDVGTQERMIRFLPWRDDHLVLPRPETYVPADISRKGFWAEAEPTPAYALDFFGVAPFRSTTDAAYCRQQQFVFDRSNGGRLVTICPADPARLRSGRSLQVQEGGCTRVPPLHAMAFALRLVLVKKRYCPDMEVRCEHDLCDQVARSIQAHGLPLSDEGLSYVECQDLFFEMECRGQGGSSLQTQKHVSQPEAPVVEPLEALELMEICDDLYIGLTTLESLWAAGVHSIADLVAHSEAELRSIPGIGDGSLRSIRKRLALFGLCLREDDGGGPATEAVSGNLGIGGSTSADPKCGRSERSHH